MQIWEYLTNNLFGWCAYSLIHAFIFSEIFFRVLGMHFFLPKPLEKDLLLTIISKLKTSFSLFEAVEGITGDYFVSVDVCVAVRM